MPAPGKELHCSIQVFFHNIVIHPTLLHKHPRDLGMMLSLYHHYIIIYDQVDESAIILTGGTPEGMRAETGVYEYSGLGQSYEVWLINTERVYLKINAK